jgi:tetratricopeptide (TPR) repeat protein
MLASFSDGFSKEAAIDVTDTTAEILSSLTSKCFIRTNDFSRYDMHEIIHQFALEKSFELEVIYQAKLSHATHFLHFLENAGKQFQDGLQKQALDLIEIDIENIRKAWGYYIENQDLDKLIYGIDILYKFYNIRSKFEEGFNFFQETLLAADYLGDNDPITGMLLNRCGSLAHRLYLNAQAGDYFKRSQSIFEGTSNNYELGLSYLGFAKYSLRKKDLDKAFVFGKKSLACFNDSNDLDQQGAAYFLLGKIHVRMGDFINAKQRFTHSLKLARQTDDQHGIFQRLNQLAGIACNEGDFDRAENLYGESLDLCRSFKDRYNESKVLNNLASVYHPKKHYDQEETVLKQSLEICREIGDQEGEAIALNNLGELALVQGCTSTTFEYSREALNIAMHIKDDWTVIAAYDILGNAYLAEEDTTSAYQCFMQAISRAHKIRSWDLLTRSTVNCAQVFLQKGEPAIARSLLESAIAHPGILYEYNLKARSLLKNMGIEPKNEKNEQQLLDALEHFLDLPSRHP